MFNKPMKGHEYKIKKVSTNRNRERKRFTKKRNRVSKPKNKSGLTEIQKITAILSFTFL